jgi:hypothetical protein
MSSIRAVQARVHLDFLAELLHLPQGYRITMVLPPDPEDILRDNTARFIIEGPDLPEVFEGAKIPYGTVEFTRQPAIIAKVVT